MYNLEDKIAIVTGGARDIGGSTSKKLASLGAKVVINYYSSAAEAEATLSAITDAGGQAITVKGDMTKQEEVDELIAATTTAFGNTVHILVNNVGGLVARKTIDEIDGNFFDTLINLNLKSAFFVTQAVRPLMPEGGSIINLSSQAAHDGGGPGSSLYAAAKGAITTITRSWAKEFGADGIRVNAVCPGMIDTTFHDTFTDDEVRTNVANSTALGREGHPDEVADLVAYLASSESSYITGDNIDINGGLAFT